MPSDKPKRRFQDILDNIERIQTYTSGLTSERFAQDSLRRDAVERCLLRIAEAATRVKGLSETLAPDQPWADIRGLGNVLRHEYEKINVAIIWDIATNGIASLKPAVEEAIRKLEADT